MECAKISKKNGNAIEYDQITERMHYNHGTHTMQFYTHHNKSIETMRFTEYIGQIVRRRQPDKAS